eukprot:6187254-Pleurochrysis_carterae.AAC.1
MRDTRERRDCACGIRSTDDWAKRAYGRTQYAQKSFGRSHASKEGAYECWSALRLGSWLAQVRAREGGYEGDWRLGRGEVGREGQTAETLAG